MSKIKEYFLNNIDYFNEPEYFDYEQYKNDIQQYEEEIDKERELAIDAMFEDFSYGI